MAGAMRRHSIAAAFQTIPLLQTFCDQSTFRLWQDHVRHHKRWLFLAVGCMIVFSA